MSATESDVKSAMATAAAQPQDNPWPDRLAAWNKFSEKFHARGTKIEKRYEDERDSAMEDGATAGGKRVNMFYSNVTVIKESLYNSIPKPSVGRLHKGDWDNDAARVAASIMERGLTYEINCAKSFDDSIKGAILDRLVPGLGTVWCSFEAPTADAPEQITIDLVYWKDFLYEPQRRWELVTWVGRKLPITKEVARQRWGDRALSADAGASKASDDSVNHGKICVIQMWDKNTKTVSHILPDGTVLDTVNDPYQLKGFFPTPKPLVASPPTRKFLPMPDYYMAQDQYMELDVLYARINLIVEAIKVAGVYDAGTPEIGRMLNGAENKLIPVDNWAMFAESGGAKGKIDWFPVEVVATVLTHLISTYEFVKTQLFEVTGMADIVRGSTNQYETAAAQQIKAQFASVRMNGFQRDVAFFVRDVVRIMGEMMCQLYSNEKLLAIIGSIPEEDQALLPDVERILRDDFIMYYNIDIEADSLTQADWGLQQEQRMAYAQSLSQFLTAALPVAQENKDLAPLMVQVIKFVSVGFKGSSELEGALDRVLDQLAQAAAQPEQPPEPTPEEIKAQAEAQKRQQEAELAREEHQMKIAMMQAEFQNRRDTLAMELQFKRESHQMELQHEMAMSAIRQQDAAAKAAQERANAEEAEENEEEEDDAGQE